MSTTFETPSYNLPVRNTYKVSLFCRKPKNIFKQVVLQHLGERVNSINHHMQPYWFQNRQAKKFLHQKRTFPNGKKFYWMGLAIGLREVVKMF